MQAGELNKKITFQTEKQVGLDKEWDDTLSTWASIKPITGREFYAAQKENSEVTHKVKLRYANVTPDMRIIYDNRTFDIISVINPDNRELLIMCKELF